MTDVPVDAPARRGAGHAVRRGLSGVAQLWLLAVIVAVWEVWTRAAGSPSFPPPSQIFKELWDLYFSGPADHFFLTEQARTDFAPSLKNLFTGWALAGVAGVVLGLAIGRFRIAGLIVLPPLHFLRSIPPPTLIPFLLAVLDIGTPLQVTTIVFGVVWPVLLNTIDGVRSVDRLQLETARVFGITGARRLFRVVLPSAAPKIFAGLRVSLGFALILMVISELVGFGQGIGAHIIDAQHSFEMTQMWAGIVLLGILGCLFNLVFHLVERWALAWHGAARRDR